MRHMGVARWKDRSMDKIVTGCLFLENRVKIMFMFGFAINFLSSLMRYVFLFVIARYYQGNSLFVRITICTLIAVGHRVKPRTFVLYLL